MQFSIRPAVPDSVLLKTSLLTDPRLSSESLGVLAFLLCLSRGRSLALDTILSGWNEGRRKEFHIGKDKFRRIVNEWRLAGYATVEKETDDDGKVTGKSVTVFRESQEARPETGDRRQETGGKTEEKRKPHRFPAAQIYQETFAVDLDLDSLKHVEREIGKEYKLWGRVCADHYASLTNQQKDSISYKTRALKFCLSDFRREQELAAYRKTKTPMQRAGEEDVSPKKKTFADYAAAYKHGSKEYANFKTGWMRKAEETGNEDALTQVEDYERVQLSLDRVKKSKGGIEK